MPKENGASLPEVVIILVLALVLGAAIIPRLLNSRIAANEAAAVANVDVITTAQQSYKTAYPQIGYADSLSRLAFVCGEHHCTPSPEHACLIDCTLPAATNHVKDGYFYNLTAGDRPTMPRTTYVVAAAAAQIHKTGDHNFCAVEDRRIRYDKPSTNTPVAELTWSACRALPILP